MRLKSIRTLGKACHACFIAAAVLGGTGVARAQLVPGTGERVAEVGDNFEDASWTYTPDFPKSSSNIDHQARLPAGISANRRIYESTYRGGPDVVKRVKPPDGGIPGSKAALLMRTLHSGIPGELSHKMQQDDLLMNVNAIVGGFVPVAWSPSCTVRVYLPAFEYWEPRTGTSFGFRADVFGSKPQAAMHWKRSPQPQMESYWPGLFVQFNSKADGRNQVDSAVILIRSGPRGEDIPGPVITQPGWWTLGMSFTPDGQVHYYASPGVDDLTAADHIGSYYPYGFRCERFETFFFNVVNQDDGRSWSTPWIIDDPAFFMIRR